GSAAARGERPSAAVGGGREPRGGQLPGVAAAVGCQSASPAGARPDAGGARDRRRAWEWVALRGGALDPRPLAPRSPGVRDAGPSAPTRSCGITFRDPARRKITQPAHDGQGRELGMAIFTEKQSGRETEASLSIIGTGLRVEGDLSSDGVVKVEGTVVGTVRATRQVLVAKGGVVEGDIVTDEAIIGGEVRGGIGARERGELQATSVVHGDIT